LTVHNICDTLIFHFTQGRTASLYSIHDVITWCTAVYFAFHCCSYVKWKICSIVSLRFVLYRKRWEDFNNNGDFLHLYCKQSFILIQVNCGIVVCRWQVQFFKLLL